MNDNAAPNRTGHFVAAVAVLCVLAALPALFARGLIADDWVVFYVHWTEGFGAVAKLLYDAAHAGLAAPYAAFLLIDQAHPNLATRLISLSAHLLNGWLIWRAFSRSEIGRPVGALMAVFYLASPFYAIRLTLNGAYDVLMTLYLVSINMTLSRGKAATLVGPVALFMSLSLETLAALEPIRLLLAWRRREPHRQFALRLLPYWTAIAIAFGLRLTVLGKHGHYAGQYDFAFEPGSILFALFTHLQSFVFGITYSLQQAAGLMALPWWGLVTVLVAITGILIGARWAPDWMAHRARTGSAIAIGIAAILTAIAGGLPYALSGLYAWPTRMETRFAFPSQFGILLLAALLIQLIPGHRLRTCIAGLCLLFGFASNLHDSKWLAYDGALLADIHRQLHSALEASPSPKTIELQLEPASTSLFFRNRCVGAQDLNVALEILRPDSRPRSFVYEPNCGDLTNPVIVPADRCPISYLDGYDCPDAHETWRFVVFDEKAAVDRLSLTGLFLDTIQDGGQKYGMLYTATGEPVSESVQGLDCMQPDIAATAWLTDLPAGACAATPSGD